MHFSDRLATAVRSKKSMLCVGLDPRRESLPDAIVNQFPPTLEGTARAFELFCLRVLDLVADAAPVVKPQSAFFELCGPAGLSALQTVLARAKQLGLITILDSKRGDIATTATAYAHAAFEGMTINGVRHAVWDADAITVNPYLGRDAVEPFLKAARASERGVFVLVRTSNPGSGLFQDLATNDVRLCEHVGVEVQRWNRENLAANGLGDVGAVVGATHRGELEQMRAKFPDVWFLVPGYGAQGATVEDVRPALRPDGVGAVVNSSRGVTFPFKPDDANWEAKIAEAARSAASELSIK